MIPVDIGRDEAAEAARRELADPAYQAAEPSWLAKAMEWVLARLDEVFTAAAELTTAGPLGWVLLGLLLLVAVFVIRRRLGPTRRRAKASHEVFDGDKLTAAGYRQTAETALAEGRLADAVRDRFRAIVCGLEERGVLDVRSGRTADEAATEAGRRLPALADELRQGATQFDDVFYGGRPATEPGYRRLVALDEAAAATRPLVGGAAR
ncbi:DUF4129 domain-containing protein [Amycolatopsis magusensis]|uniref:Protein-glutamine gamma-glutamyltransferase-like C-terminal domain-containing protein n=1 Tax=Amycolatopsis magusensis TaxID=882444 RepID=A0ABS4PQH1_9PSEU|nr:DUF4129 domain-containing protein [Amycolatopsis magusensis]MBP2180866.1 hypothetical protein [Amycolatopsis magusensis]MDI5982214.1 DUF4129 domain-containing protein [Amycolatopsis magusensis]